EALSAALRLPREEDHVRIALPRAPSTPLGWPFAALCRCERRRARFRGSRMKGIAAVVGLVCTVIGTLLALVVILPLGGQKPAGAPVTVQTAPGGTTSTITFPTVTSGGSTPMVPDVRGESLDQAEQDLRAAGYSNLTTDEAFTSDQSLVG